MEYNQSELLIATAARQMEDGAICFIGTGIPMLAAALAKRTHAPNLVAAFEFGGVGPSLERLPLAVGGSRTFHRAPVASSICDLMEAAARGHVEYGFLGGAQIDPYGNLNATVIGAHDSPKVRFPGSGPYRVITDLAVLGYDAETCRMQLLATQPGVTVAQVQENTGFELLLAETITENPPPTDAELRLLREEIDPEHLYT